MRHLFHSSAAPARRRVAVVAVAWLASAPFALASCTAPNGRPAAPAPSPVRRELADREQAQHALDRLAYGPRPGEVERLLAVGVDRWIAAQLAPESIADTAGARIDAAFPLLRATPAEVFGNAPDARAATDTAARRAAQRRANQVATELRVARVARAVASERQLQEVLVDLWANHFSVYAGKGPVRLHVARYEHEAIRPHVLGRFRDMLGAVAHSPAMLYYLDNWRSVADSGQPVMDPRGGRRRAARWPGTSARAPRGKNENYARELLELHTLGVDGGYTQRDVSEVARAFTGWTIAAPRQGGGFVFRLAAHDAGEKTILGVRIPAGGDESDGERVLDILARHPATARTVATLLARRFVSDDPPPALVERVAAVFERTDGDLRATTAAVIESPEFWSRAAYRAKVKSPLELVASGMRAVGMSADLTPRAARMVAQLGQPLYGRQSPDGWPERSIEWLTAGSLVSRINFGLALGGRAGGDSARVALGSPDFQRR